MNTLRWFTQLVPILVLALLSGCGGGGGMTPPTSSTESYAAQALSIVGGYRDYIAYGVTADGQIIGGASGTSADLCNWLRDASGNAQLLPGDGVEVSSINNAGQAVGSADYHSYIIDLATGDKTQLAEPKSGDCVANDISDAGLVVGDCGGDPFSWDATGQATALLVPDDASGGKALCCNEAGLIGGYVRGWDGWHQAVIWNQDGTINRDIATDIDYKGTQTVLINDAGYIAIRCFQALTAGKLFNAVMLRSPSGAVVELGKLGYPGALAKGINAGGQIAGAICSDVNCEYPQRAVVWATDGSANELPMPTGCVRSWATGINDTGRVVGCAIDSSGILHAVTWAIGS